MQRAALLFGLKMAADPQASGQESDNLFVTDMPPGLTEEEMTEILGQYGTILSLKKVSKDGNARSAALVRYASEEEAGYVQSALDGNIPQGLETPITVRYAQQGNNGKPAATAPDTTTTASYGKMGGGGGGKWGGEKQQSSIPYPMKPGWSRAGKGGSVGMDDIVAALEATGQLPGGATFVNDEGCLFIAGLPKDCNDLHLYRIFAPFGPIYPQGVRACNTGKGGGGVCRGYGFVNYMAPESAQAAILTLNGAILPDGTVLKVQIKSDKK